MTDPSATDAAQPPPRGSQLSATDNSGHSGEDEPQQADLVSRYDDDQLAVPNIIFHG